MEPGEKFAIVIFVNTPDAVHPLAIEYAADATTAKVDLSDGEGYISPDGRTWESAEDTQSCNLCIKAYAEAVQEYSMWSMQSSMRFLIPFLIAASQIIPQ